MLVLQRHASLAAAALKVMGQVLRLRFILFGYGECLPQSACSWVTRKGDVVILLMVQKSCTSYMWKLMKHGIFPRPQVVIAGISEPWTVSNTRPVAVCYIDGMVDCISTRNWWSCCINTWPGEEHSLGCIRRIWLTEKYIFWNHGTIGCTPDSVPLLFIVVFFFLGFLNIMTHKYPLLGPT